MRNAKIKYYQIHNRWPKTLLHDKMVTMYSRYLGKTQKTFTCRYMGKTINDFN